MNSLITDYDVDEIISKLLEAKKYTFYLNISSFKPNKLVVLAESEIKWLCLKAKEIFMEQPVFLELFSPLNLCGKLVLYNKQVIFMVSSTIYSDYLNTVVIPELRIIYSSVIMWIEEKIH